MSFVHRVDELLDEHGNGLTGKAEHWQRVRLGAVAHVVNGYPFPSAGFNSERGEAVLRIRDISAGKIGTYFKGAVGNAPRVAHSDLVVGMDGDFNSCLWPGEPALMNQRVCKIVPNEAVYSKRLLAYALPGYLKLVNDHTSAITVKHLSSGTVADLPLPLPPRPEQDRLVSKLDELFSRIDEGERALAQVLKLVERYRQSILKAAVTGELTREWREKNNARLESGEALLARIIKVRREAWERVEFDRMNSKGITPANDRWKQNYEDPAPPEVSELPALPEHWTWATAETVCESVHSGTTPERALLQATPSDGVPFIKVHNLTMHGWLDFSIEPTFVEGAYHRERMRRSRTLPGDVLTNIVGPPLGKVSVVPTTHPEWNINQAIAAFRAGNDVLSELLSVHLQSELAQAWLRSTTKTTTSQVNLAVTTCRRLPVPIPPLAEQAAICARVRQALSNAGAMISAMQDGNMRAAALRQSILRRAFSGQLLPQNPLDEPASKLLERIAADRGTDGAFRKRGSKKKTAA